MTPDPNTNGWVTRAMRAEAEAREWREIADRLADELQEYQVHNVNCRKQYGQRCTCSLDFRLAALAAYNKQKKGKP